MGEERCPIFVTYIYFLAAQPSLLYFSFHNAPNVFTQKRSHWWPHLLRWQLTPHFHIQSTTTAHNNPLSAVPSAMSDITTVAITLLFWLIVKFQNNESYCNVKPNVLLMLALNHRTKHTSVTVLTDLHWDRVWCFFKAYLSLRFT